MSLFKKNAEKQFLKGIKTNQIQLLEQAFLDGVDIHQLYPYQTNWTIQGFTFKKEIHLKTALEMAIQFKAYDSLHWLIEQGENLTHSSHPQNSLPLHYALLVYADEGFDDQTLEEFYPRILNLNDPSLKMVFEIWQAMEKQAIEKQQKNSPIHFDEPYFEALWYQKILPFFQRESLQQSIPQAACSHRPLKHL